MKANNKIRVRIAPSPTGPLHIGTARTALFNYLFTKKYKGSFILRIEDTDLERSNPKYEKDIIDGLKWLGIKWDGKIYKQSERIGSYTKYLKKLLDKGQAPNQNKFDTGRAFFCYHSEKELEKERKEKMKRKEAPIHVCEHYNKRQETRGMRHGIIRFRPPKKKIVFDDLIRGGVELDSQLLGDISIAKNLKTPLYNFAVVVDDYEMKISHVIRGEDHISNTPKQILLQEALGFSKPKYAHLPLILGPDKSKLSKRHGAVSVNEYRKQGYLPKAMINFMALLGWSAQGGPAGGGNPREEEIFSMKELIKEFSLKKTQKGGAIFNIEKLDWFNGYYIRKRDSNELTALCVPYLIKNGLIEPKFKSEQYPPAYGGYSFKEEYVISETKEKIEPGRLKQIIILEQERMKKLSEIGELAEFFFKDKLKYPVSLLKWRAMTNQEIGDTLDRLEKVLSKIKEKDFTAKKLEKILMPEAERMGDRGKLLWPLRVALSGRKTSPGPFEIAEVLEKKKVLKRVKGARNKVK